MLASSTSTSTGVQQWVQRPSPCCSKFDAGNEFLKLARSIIIRCSWIETARNVTPVQFSPSSKLKLGPLR